jgi:hypothetical protein
MPSKKTWTPHAHTITHLSQYTIYKRVWTRGTVLGFQIGEFWGRRFRGFRPPKFPQNRNLKNTALSQRIALCREGGRVRVGVKSGTFRAQNSGSSKVPGGEFWARRFLEGSFGLEGSGRGGQFWARRFLEGGRAPKLPEF